MPAGLAPGARALVVGGSAVTGRAAAGGGPRIEFVRLTEVPVSAVLGLLNEPRNRRHMPLSSRFTEEAAVRWIADKDGQWQRHGYGPWAVLVEGEFAGWGGFRREEYGVGYTLVLAGAVGA